MAPSVYYNLSESLENASELHLDNPIPEEQSVNLGQKSKHQDNISGKE